jgi:putative hydrolase of the HAD superfamily
MTIVAIWDLDDTLILTGRFYHECRDKAFTHLASLGFDPAEAERILETEIEPANIKVHGFAAHRFPRSLSDLYEILCGRHAVPMDPWNRFVMEGLGWSVYEADHPVVAGAEAALGLLVAAGIPVVLLTKGDDRIQRQKLERTVLAPYFNHVYVVPDKHPEVYHTMLAQLGIEAKHAFMVGDSIKSDVNPALAVGMKAIWIEGERPWSHEVEDLTAGYTKVVGLSEAANIILEAHRVVTSAKSGG